MDTHSVIPKGQAAGLAEHAQNRGPAPKWAALIDDTMVFAPQHRVRASVLLAQAGVQDGKDLVRDHGRPDDVAIAPNEIIDLGKGNVFYTAPACDAPPKRECLKPAKLALFVDDRPEVTLNPHQTGKTIRELFGLTDDVPLFRDYESPQDEAVGLADDAPFEKGPVYVTKRVVQYRINIEGKSYSWNKPTITTAELRKLGNLPADQAVVCEDAEGRERTLREDEVVTLDPCCQFGRAPKYKRG